jgi:alpha-ribazole phosphatase
MDVAADLSDRAWIARVAAALPHEAVWVTSQLRRTRETAEALLTARAPTAASGPLIEPDLAEQHFGHWQGLGHEAIALWQDEAAHQFWAAPARTAPPGGESFATLVERASGTLERLVETYRGREIVLVVHGGTVRAALAFALCLSPEQALGFEVDNLSLTHMKRLEPGAGEARFVAARGPWRVKVVNRSFRTNTTCT